MTGAPRWFRAPSAVLGILSLVVALGAEIGFGRGGGSPSDFSLFVGHFHPLVVHLPIGVLVLLGAAEVATFFPRYRQRIDPVLGLSLPVLLVVTITAFVLGHLLARGGGFAAHALALHRRLEFFAVVAACATTVVWAYHEADGSSQSRTAYRGALFTTLALLSVGAHFGGTVTHGESYLTEYAPGPFKSLLGGGEKSAPSASGSAGARKPPSAEPLVYADVVAPILRKYCVNCHGPKKSKGKLRLDSIEAILKGGEDGPAIVLGSSATSELMKRVRLPVDDDDRMPPESKPGPKPEELAVIAFFIDRGASPALRVRDTLAPESGRKVLEAALGRKPNVPTSTAGPEPKPADSERTREPPAESASAAASAPAKERAKPDESAERAAPTEAHETRSKEPATPPAEPAAPAEKKAPAAPAGARAILAEKCEKCHGPTKKKGGLRVDSVEALLAGGEDGPVIVAGDAERSELVRRVRAPVTEKKHMPPKKEPQLSDAEVATLAAWVRGLARGGAGASRPLSSGASASSETPVAPANEHEASPSAEPERAPVPEAAATAPEASSSSAELPHLPPRLVLYEQAVAPLFSKRCGKCHAGAKPSARLRINDYAALLEGGLSGPGIVPGKPDDSLVVHRIGLPANDDDHMPPEGEPSMTDDEVALVREWVKRGAGRKLEVATKDLPLPAQRAAADYVSAAGAEPLHAGAGCAACSVGAVPASWSPFAVAGLAFGAFVVRRGRRSREREPKARRPR